jgi:hypothetical protein
MTGAPYGYPVAISVFCSVQVTPEQLTWLMDHF